MTLLTNMSGANEGPPGGAVDGFDFRFENTRKRERGVDGPVLVAFAQYAFACYNNETRTELRNIAFDGRSTRPLRLR